ncbi:hypothetical protein TVD_07000 [Thioalkalivibrio versutus]|uniref:Uncharacterized protein n=1 Tax=Thioalkalivibrio versutus TaxID=106634 RepID=A0A0G3G6P0_9GAMM|nr:hypothetical protein TVD_07000 [Thioalkalivibrio versutus]
MVIRAKTRVVVPDVIPETAKRLSGISAVWCARALGCVRRGEIPALRFAAAGMTRGLAVVRRMSLALV